MSKTWRNVDVNVVVASQTWRSRSGNLAEISWRDFASDPMELPYCLDRLDTSVSPGPRTVDPRQYLRRSVKMASSAPNALRHCCSHASAVSRSQKRSLSFQCFRMQFSYHSSRSQSPQRRWQSTEAAAPSSKVSGIVDQISQLTLLETADLVQSLKVCSSYQH